MRKKLSDMTKEQDKNKNTKNKKSSSKVSTGNTLYKPDQQEIQDYQRQRQVLNTRYNNTSTKHKSEVLPQVPPSRSRPQRQTSMRQPRVNTQRRENNYNANFDEFYAQVGNDQENQAVGQFNHRQSSSNQNIRNNNSRSSSAPTNTNNNTYQNVVTRSRFQKQYERHFTDAQNVFYQHPSEMNQLEWVEYFIPILIKLIGILLFFYFLAWQVDPYEKKCPRHATCGAYAHCHDGYILNKYQNCEINPQVKEMAHVIADSEIQRLQTIFGDKQCSAKQKGSRLKSLQLNDPPKITYVKFFQTEGIQSKALQTQLIQIFTDQNHQKLMGFETDSFGNIYPTRRQYSLTCTLNLFYNDHFILSLLLMLIFGILVIVFIYYCYLSLMNQIANKIYNYLLTQVMNSQDGIIEIDSYMEELRQKNGGRDVSKNLWTRINEQRVKDQKVGSFEDTALKWALLERMKKKTL